MTLKTRLITFLASSVFKMMARSFRYQWPEGGHCSRYVIAIWHQNLFAGISAKIHIPHIAMVSRSKDGDIAAGSSERIGYIIARGSSSRGGGEAMEAMIEALKQHPTVPAALTVDGPRGPIHQCKRGVVHIARALGMPILPYIALAEHYWEFRSWDRFRLPKPFSRVVCFVGPEIHVPSETPLEEFSVYQDKVTLSLMELEKKAQAYFNR